MIRFFFKGTIHFLTAFHIGAPGGIKESVDNPVLTDVYGNPVLPGSTIKGLIRSSAEHVAQNLGLNACGLFYKINEVNCATLLSDKAKTEFVNELEEMEKKYIENPDLTILSFLKDKLCDVCWLFGSTYHASKIRFPDPILIQESWINRIERRDGVGIDRDSGLSVDGVKYDFETVPAGVRYAFEAEGEDLAENDLALLGASLLEMAGGYLSLGGKKSRGLGKFRLEDLKVARVDLNNPSDFFQFLLGEKDKFKWEDGKEFFEGAISNLLNNLQKKQDNSSEYYRRIRFTK